MERRRYLKGKKSEHGKSARVSRSLVQPHMNAINRRVSTFAPLFNAATYLCTKLPSLYLRWEFTMPLGAAGVKAGEDAAIGALEAALRARETHHGV